LSRKTPKRKHSFPPVSSNHGEQKKTQQTISQQEEEANWGTAPLCGPATDVPGKEEEAVGIISASTTMPFSLALTTLLGLFLAMQASVE